MTDNDAIGVGVEQDAGGWRPIESAPKEAEWSNVGHEYGPRIIAYPVWGEVSCVRWWQSRHRDASNFLDDGGNAAYPTYWMPLPAPPVDRG